MHLVECKRQALESLKMMTIRYMMERTPEEQAAFFATTAATDVGCDYDSALLGTTELTDDKGEFTTGCGGEDCACEVCVCTTLGHQECCEKPGGGDNLDGTGWTGACADICLSQCHGGAIRPCTSETQIFDDWFAFLNHGFNKTGVGNSDSHDTKAEVGLPRNWVPANSDSPNLLDPNVIYQNIKKFRVVLSTGPFVEFTINGAMLGDTITKPEGSTLKAHLKVQTPSWFGIDHIEIHRNGILEEILRIAPEPTAIVDFDDTIELPMPTEDSWYVVIVYGLDAQYLMSPVYKQMPLGKILIPTIISLGAQSILISFQSVLTEVENELGGLMGEGGIDSLLGGLMGLAEKPDSFPMLPFAATNPIWVDLDGSGWKPPAYDESEQLADGSWPLPPFCSQSCDVAQARDPDDNP